MINTTDGPKHVDRGDHRHINTSRVVEEDLLYEDEEPGILAVLPATGWHAQMVGGEAVRLVAFVAMDDGKMYGVAVEDGTINLTHSVEDRVGFAGYVQANNNDTEEK